MSIYLRYLYETGFQIPTRIIEINLERMKHWSNK